jgi:DNA helicase II / ATP-dependent DNA helicase PcrA
MDYLNNLNEQQLAAVKSEAPFIRVVAGAGSGKTRVLTTRISYLIEHFNQDPLRVLAITFTNKAAKEMQDRVFKNLNGQKMPHISTIHSLCVSILRQDIVFLNYPRNFTIMDEDDQKVILKEAHKQLGLDSKAVSSGQLLSYISANKGGHVDVEKAKAMAMGNYLEMHKAQVYEYYTQRQQGLMALDFDDLLLWTLRLFDQQVEVRKKWQRKFQCLLVDEFQDIDYVQYAIIRHLVGQYNSLFVVGDPDQTIYTWRGADVNIIMNFEKDFPAAKTYILDRNYRSTSTILGAANKVIANNRQRVKKELQAVNQAVDHIVYYQGYDQETEALWVGSKIKDLVIKEHLKYRDFAILYRANYLSRAVEKAMTNMHLPYVIYGGLRFYERKEVKDFLSYLRLIVSGDDLALKRVINEPKRKIGDKTIEIIEEAARKQQCAMFEILTQSDLFSGQTKSTLLRFHETIMMLRNKLDKLTLVELAELVLDVTGYKMMLIESNELERLENVKEVISDLKEFTESYPEASLDEYLQMISLYIDRDLSKGSDMIQLLTIHASKGLEYPIVFVVGMNEGVFPSDRSLQDGISGLEEERRLAYVAFTRAEKKLILTSSRGYDMRLGKERTTSRFINEIGNEHLMRHGFDESALSNPNRIINDQEGEIVNLVSEAKKPIVKWRINDIVMHDVYTQGVVVKVTEQFLEIAFPFPHGIKKILPTFPGMRKVEKA